MKKHYPTIKELDKLWWYRLVGVLRWIIVGLAVIAPAITKNGLWYFDGVINGVIWYFILAVIWLIAKYIIYGKCPNTQEIKLERRKRHSKILKIILVIAIWLILVVIVN